MSNIVNIGIMGCASIAQRLMIPALQQMPSQFKIAAIASRTKEKADQFAEQFGCEGVVGYDNLLNNNDIDAIYMPLPTGLHREWILKALRAGKHVYAEKSIAMTAEDAEVMVSEAKQRDLALMEGYMFQYHQQHVEVKNLLKTGKLGEPRIVRASFGFPPFSDSQNFRYDNKIGGGALKDAAGYVWRCVNFLFGNIFEVKASNVYYDEKGTSLYGSAFLTANDKLSAEISFGFDNFYQCNYEIWGSKAKLTCCRAFTPKPDETTKILVEYQGSQQQIDIPPFNHFVGAMDEFYALIKGNHSKQRHYDDILYQAKGLDQIEEQSKSH